jgi:hypothetical protein
MMTNIPTWIVVLIGLLFSILSVLISHFYIDEKVETLNHLSMDIKDNENQISLFWRQIAEIERKRETYYLLINQGELNKTIEKQISHLLTLHLHQAIDLTDIQSVDRKIDDYQSTISNLIDEKFIENLGLEERASKLESEISSLRNWSIFLQMIGLTLILARDLSRKGK